MKIDLPDLDIKEDWTIESQLKKIREEFLEVCEAVDNNDPVNIIKESYDLMQTGKTLITIVLNEYDMNLKRFQKEHIEKLARKGYLREENRSGYNTSKPG